MQILVERLKSLNGGRILDVATGRGSFISILQEGLKDYDEIIGIDKIDAEKLAKFNESFEDKRIRLINMDAAKLDFENEMFDIVTISNSLHHLEDSSLVLSEMLRVLKPGGIFIINEMICDNQSPSQMTHVLMHHWWGKIDTALGILHDRTLTKQQLLTSASSLNLKNFEVLEWIDSDDPMDKAAIEQTDKIIDQYIERARPLTDYEAFRLEGEEIKKHLYAAGVNSAAQVIVIQQK